VKAKAKAKVKVKVAQVLVQIRQTQYVLPALVPFSMVWHARAMLYWMLQEIKSQLLSNRRVAATRKWQYALTSWCLIELSAGFRWMFARESPLHWASESGFREGGQGLLKHGSIEALNLRNYVAITAFGLIVKIGK
jgi:hypothetical protein